ncbi:thymidylate kinase [Suhomyces tanzawaensis NRRL Y-17324]|uniref:Thymidylate kinase n=1 Tax=Suhomyces tanzawaensis NRRL Y-17324 TaxID=984487 RepID=A0A1E4SEN7_9ASCO|nr:thymidylate kinase [Suhomyces tanzawaensis NRRL Y-17324]ODV77926.1 thymidylate kinase [Suhomyces tanzawaensis NRRL Y-17324]
MRGQLILIEGLDRSGKSTQAGLLTERLAQAHSSQLYKFPDRSTPIGALINKYLTDSSFQLDDHSAHLLFSANRWELYTELLQALNDGKFVVLDRYIYSGIAYSLAKSSLKHASSELGDVDWLYSPDKGLPKPDLTLFLSLSIEELGKRKGWGQERYELEQFQKEVKSCFLRILDPSKDSTVHLVNVEGKSIHEVQQVIWDVVVEAGCDKLTELPVQKLD